MGNESNLLQGGRRINLAPALSPVPAASTVLVATVPAVIGGVQVAILRTQLVYSSGGTTLKFFLQTSFDGGVNWMDVACHAYTTANATKVSKVSLYAALAAGVTPTDGTLADNTIVDGALGDQLRLKYIVAGTYVASTFSADLIVKGG